MIASAALVAMRGLRRNVVRSLLTALGIVIGVAAVVTLVTVGSGAAGRVTADITKLGTNLLIVTPGSDRRGPISAAAEPIAGSDVAALTAELGTAARLAPSVNRASLVVYGGTNHSTLVTGSTPEFTWVRAFAIARGRMFSETEAQSGQRVCVIGATVQRELFRSASPLGATVRVGRTPCKVIGVFASKGGAALGGDQDDVVLMPLRAVQRRITGSTDVDAIYVGVTDERATDRVRARITALMRELRGLRHGQADDFAVQDMRDILSTLSSVTGMLVALLAAIAGVSLVVGGIGIMNIMLVSVTERTREIGIRLAIGAPTRAVLTQFLVEAVVLSVMGGLVGLAFGVLAAWGLCAALGLVFAPSIPMMVLAVGFSAAVGVVFGFLPARRAARLDPITALRHE
jgi:putative ABC transport system permease protein